MTRQHYERAAALVATYPTLENRVFLMLVFSRFFAADSPRFDRERFAEACNAVIR